MKQENTTKLEQQFLISLIHQPETIPDAGKFVDSTIFTSELHKGFYKAFQELFAEQIPIDLANTFTKLQENNVAFSENDVQIFYEEPTTDSPIKLAKLLHRRHIEKTAKLLLQSKLKDLGEGFDTATVLSSLASQLEDLSEDLVDKDEKDWSSKLEDFAGICLSELQEMNQKVIPTPYPTLNHYINGGFEPGSLVTIGARPGIGKTTLATNCMAYAASQGKSVLMFSLEMSEEENIKRLVACHGDILLNHLKPGAWRTAEVVEKIKQTVQEVKTWNTTIDDSADLTMEAIKLRAIREAQSEKGLDMIVIDYLQLISTKGSKGRSRQEEVAEISRTCKKLARQLQVPILILVQVNREGKDEDENRLPRMADIRESGAIAADSDIVILLHRNIRDDSNDPKVTVILDKNRRGQAGKIFTFRSVLEKNLFQDTRADREETVEEETAKQGWANPEDVPEEDMDDGFDDIFEDEEWD